MYESPPVGAVVRCGRATRWARRREARPRWRERHRLDWFTAGRLDRGPVCVLRLTVRSGPLDFQWIILGDGALRVRIAHPSQVGRPVVDTPVCERLRGA